MESKELQTSDEIDLVAFMSPLLARWKLLFLVTLLGATAGFSISRMLPKTYRSSATIYVQQSSGMTSFLRNLPIAMGPTNAGTASGYLISVLQSNTLAERVQRQLRLKRNKNYIPMPGCLKVQENKNGSIIISCIAHEPKLAADIVNKMIDNLGSLVVTSSKRKAAFISEKLDATTHSLSLAEDRLKVFLEKNDVAAIDEDTKGLIQSMSELDGQLLTVGQELESVKSELENAGELDSLVDKEVRKKSLESSRDFMLQKREELRARLAKLPAMASEYARRQRDVMVLEKTYELLVEQYQLASITQKGEDGDYQILDRAEPDPRKIAPHTIVNTAFTGMLCFVITAFMVKVAAFQKPRTGYKRVAGRPTMRV